MIATTIDDYITLPIIEFSRFTGIGQTLVRQMVADGRLRAVRVGRKRLLVDVSSYREMIARQSAEGLPEYDGVTKARKTRMANRAAAKEAKQSDANSLLEEAGL